jgi:type I restriction enzyme R subunit
MTGFAESVVEQATIDWLEALGWSVVNGADIAPGEPNAERADYAEVVLAERLRNALGLLNPQLTADAVADAFRKLTA